MIFNKKEDGTKFGISLSLAKHLIGILGPRKQIGINSSVGFGTSVYFDIFVNVND